MIFTRYSKFSLGLILISVIVISSCKKDPQILENNDPPYYAETPTVLVEFYINRLFIDLIGREPFDEEMANEVAFLRSYDLSMEGRDSLILKLQTDTNYIPGDSSYKILISDSSYTTNAFFM